MPWEWRKVIFLEEVVHAHPQQLRNEAYVVQVVKPVQQVDAFTTICGQYWKHGKHKENVLLVGRIPLLELLQYAYLYLASVAVLRDSADNLDGHSLLGLGIDGFDDLPKGTLAQETNSPI